LNQFGTNTVSSFDYVYDEISRRTQRTDLRPLDLGLSTNSFAYNTRSELTSAAMSTNDYSYAYDSIGNRLTASTPLTSSTYGANELNQYSRITNNQSQITSLSYDSDGNLTNDSVNAYTWDGENRLVKVTPINPTTNNYQLTFAYDAQCRRFEKTVNATNTTRFVYDGWNLISEISQSTNNVSTNYYVWGLHLSQTLQGTGRVGGLLSQTTINSTTTIRLLWGSGR